MVLNGSNPNSTRARGAVPRLRVGLGLDGMDITGSKALPWNPLPSRLRLPNRQTIEFRLHSKARLSLGGSAFPGRACEREKMSYSWPCYLFLRPSIILTKSSRILATMSLGPVVLMKIKEPSFSSRIALSIL